MCFSTDEAFVRAVFISIQNAFLWHTCLVNGSLNAKDDINVEQKMIIESLVKAADFL